MNPLALPWSIVIVALLFLFLLFLREVLLFLRTPKEHPDRSYTLFNCAVLLGFFIAGLMGADYLFKRDQEFSYIFPRYPSARYAPEREILQEGSDWIYITSDEPSRVIAFYKNMALVSGYTTTGEDVASSTHLLITRGEKNYFLTAQKEAHSTVLYFSLRGEVKHYKRTPL